MDPFSIDEIFQMTHFSGAVDKKGRPRKVKPHEKCLMCAVASLMKCRGEISKAAKQGATEGKGGVYHVMSKTIKLLENGDVVKREKLAAMTGYTYRRVVDIVTELKRLNVLDEKLELVGFSYFRN